MATDYSLQLNEKLDNELAQSITSILNSSLSGGTEDAVAAVSDGGGTAVEEEAQSEGLVDRAADRLKSVLPGNKGADKGMELGG